ncbi:ion transporter [halophilic archaeon]|nr:ion transporter [halophilic archaeon]
MGQSVPPDRCGYSPNVSRFPDLGGVCCWRPIWDDANRCVWHADTVDKPADVLATLAPTPGERLDGARLRRSTLSDVDWFVACTLVEADFTQADISATDFTDADLRDATFRDANARGTMFARANLEDAVVRNVDLRGAHFGQAKFDEADFTKSRINRATTFGERFTYEIQLSQTSAPDERRDLFASATWTYRTLQRLAHQNARRGQQYEYYQREMSLRRRFAWTSGYYLSAIRLEASRWLTGYGRNPWRVIGTSLVVIVGFAVLYPITGGLQEVEAERAITYTINEPAEAPTWWVASVFLKSLYFSVITFATVGYGDFQPIGSWARALAGVEALLGGLLMALFVVVFTRRITWL